MTDIQHQQEYMQLLVSIPDLLEEYFLANNIHDQEQAKYFADREIIAGFYPMLKAYATELEVFYGHKVEPIDANDRAEAAYLLSISLHGHVLDDCKFADVSPISESGYSLAAPIHQLFDWAQNLPAEEDKKHATSWAMFLSNIADAYLDTVATQRKAELYEQIDDRDLGQSIAIFFSNKRNLLDNIEALNGILYDNCIRYVENGLDPNRQDLTEQILSRIKGYENVVTPEQMYKIVYQSTSALSKIIVSDHGVIAEVMENRHHLTLLQHANDSAVLSAEELRLQIFRQKLAHQWEAPIRISPADLSLSKPIQLPKDYASDGELQKLELQQHTKDQFQQDKWQQYEKSRTIVEGSELFEGLRDLLRNALASDFYPDKGQVPLVNFELNQLFKVLSVTDNRPINSLVARNLLDFTKEMMVFSEHSEKYLGKKLTDSKLDRKLLAEMSYADSLTADNFNVLAPFWASFSSHYQEINQIITTTKFIEPSNNLYQQIEALPDSLEKFGAVELYYHANMAIQRLMISKERETWEASLQSMSQLHQAQFNKFSNNLDVIASAYPELEKYGINKLAHELERGVCSSYLVHGYLGDDNFNDADSNLFDEVEDIAALGAFPEQAISSIFKATDDFTEAAILQHTQEINSPIAEDISINLNSYQTYYKYTEQLMDNVNNSADLLKEQSSIYFRYNLYKTNHEGQEFDKSINYELLAKNVPGRN